MHEYPVTQRIIEIAARHCKEAGADKVTRIALVAGNYCGISSESFDMYFGLIAEGTPCEGALVEFERIESKQFYIREIEVE
jgi:hydrogenase nickel incorporation protein HypA/HybF